MGRLGDTGLYGEHRDTSTTLQYRLDACCVCVRALEEERLLTGQTSPAQIWYFIHLSLVFTMGAKDLNSPYTAPDDAGAAVLQLLVVLQVIYIWNMCLTKVSVLLWYYRTFQLWFMSRFYLVLLGAVVLACTVAVSFVSVFMCAPVQKLWHQNMDGRCLDYVNVWIAKAAMAVSTDLAVVLFPLPHVFTLNLGLAEKASVAFLFAMGFL